MAERLKAAKHLATGYPRARRVLAREQPWSKYYCSTPLHRWAIVRNGLTKLAAAEAGRCEPRDWGLRV